MATAKDLLEKTYPGRDGPQIVGSSYYYAHMGYYSVSVFDSDTGGAIVFRDAKTPNSPHRTAIWRCPGKTAAQWVAGQDYPAGYHRKNANCTFQNDESS